MAMRVKPEQIRKLKSLTEFGMGKSPDKIAEEKAEEQRASAPSQPAYSGYTRPAVDLASEFKGGINPWDIPMPTVPAILVCPNCKTDVDECEKLSDGSDSAFCRCPKCEVGFFIFELMKQKSWRRKFDGQSS